MDWFTQLDAMTKIVILIIGCMAVGGFGLFIAGMCNDEYPPF